MKKKVLVSALVLAMAGAALVGCGKKSTETEKATEAAEEKATEAKATEAKATEAATEAAATEAAAETEAETAAKAN